MALLRLKVTSLYSLNGKGNTMDEMVYSMWIKGIKKDNVFLEKNFSLGSISHSIKKGYCVALVLS